jgi:hypothetical protein
MKVYELGHGRAGDKGDTSNISVIAYSDDAWQVLLARLTEARVKETFAPIVRGDVKRYVVPRLRALNFVLDGALWGGVTRSLAQDAHGKSLSTLMMNIEL